ncbi:hypothetical protein P7K49_024415 [Saguinus oedipus]|uniref:Sortilin N-terminal domain-containing protein n=1 Tax=Saguinus oedipus TaxID=9490 RepID=A0ABQ9UQ94_SAGOE|nr:hypothetical protein P7K49_024415 [Saguinus oedipus]
MECHLVEVKLILELRAVHLASCCHRDVFKGNQISVFCMESRCTAALSKTAMLAKTANTGDPWGSSAWESPGPPGPENIDMHVISTDENQVFAAVQEWNQNDTYNLYISDTRGVYFTLALENVQSSRGPEGNVMIDLYERFLIERILADTEPGTNVPLNLIVLASRKLKAIQHEFPSRIGILINDDEEHFGLIDNDSSPQLSGKGCVGSEAIWLTNSECKRLCTYDEREINLKAKLPEMNYKAQLFAQVAFDNAKQSGADKVTTSANQMNQLPNLHNLALAPSPED